MADDATSLYILIAIAIVAVVGLGLSLASFGTNQSMTGMMGGGGNGMMGGGTGTAVRTSPGLFEWTVLILSVSFLSLAVALLMRNRGARPLQLPGMPTSPVETSLPATDHRAPMSTPASATASAPAAPLAVATAAATSPAIAEPTLVKLLDEDERRMYLEIRSHGGQMLQRDLVALEIFSKAKVTRVLDKLETKGLVVREAHGMTNRVRLTPAGVR